MNKENINKPVLRILLSVLAMLGTVHVCGWAKVFHEPGAPLQYLVLDDSMITLRVAHNFAMHLGPYFNTGEHLAANTSLLWPIVLSLCFKVTANPANTVLLVSIVSGLLMALSTGLVTYCAESLVASLLTAATLLVYPGLRAYGSSAWEHVPQALLVSLAFLVLLGRVPRLRAYAAETCLMLLSLAFLMRPDTLPLMLPVGIGVLFYPATKRTYGYAAIALSGLILLFYYGLHHHYYGTFVPNTFHLKVHLGIDSVVLGAHYVSRELFASAVPTLLVGLLLLMMVQYRRLVYAERIVLAALTLQLLYIIVIGGDYFLYGRFFLMLAPITIMLFWEKVLQAEATGQSRTRSRALATICVLAMVIANMRQSIGEYNEKAPVYRTDMASTAPDDADVQAVLAGYLQKRITPEDGQVGLFVLGSLSYYLPEYRMADFLGKADTVIANEPAKWGPVGHNKWDIPYTLQARHVSVIPFHKLPEDTARHMLAAHADYGFEPSLQFDPYLNSHYTYRTAKQLGSPGTLGLYIRNDLLSRFPEPL